MFAFNADRNPFISAGSAAIINNYVYDWYFGMTVNGNSENKGPVQASISGNYLSYNSAEKYSIYMVGGLQNGTSYYIANGTNHKANYYNTRGDEIKLQTDPWPDLEYRNQAREKSDSIAPPPEWVKVTSPPLWPSGNEEMAALDVPNHVFVNAGARPADRDAVDKRVVEQVKSNAGKFIDSQEQVGSWPILEMNDRELTIPTNYSQIQSSGYTKLEEWLHQHCNIVEGKAIFPPKNLRSN